MVVTNLGYLCLEVTVSNSVAGTHHHSLQAKARAKAKKIKG